MRRPAVFPRQEWFARRLRRARSLAVALDFDGTLAPLAPAGRARMARGTRDALARLARAPGVRVAVFSGRRRRDLVRLVGVRRVALFGASGAEVPRAYAQVVRRPARFARRFAGLLASLRAWCSRHGSAWLEDKGPIVEVHFGGLRGVVRARFAAGVRRRLAPHAGRLSLTRLARGLEIGERGRPDKGTALAAWLARGERGALVCCIGDDANDRPAFAVTRRRGGIAIGVGRAFASARVTLANPREVGRLLDRLERAWVARRPRRTPTSARLAARVANPPPTRGFTAGPK